MAELQKLMESNGAFKSELLKNYLSSAPSSSSFFSSSSSLNSQSQSLTTNTNDNSQIIDNSNTGSFYGNTQTTTSNLTSQTSTDNCGNVQGNRGVESRTAPSTTNTPSATPISTTGPQAADPNANNNLQQGNTGEVESRLLSRVEGALSDSQRLLVDQVTEAVVQSHLATCSNTHARVAQAWQQAQDCSSSAAANLSEAASTMWQQFTTNMAPEIGKAIGFCKSLPGLAELAPEDQMNLIKQGSFEVMLARFSMLVDHVSETMMDPGHKMKCSKEVVLAMPMGGFLKEFFPIAARLNPLGLTDGEIGLFTAVLFICPDRAGLKNKDKVGKIQFLLTQALYCQMKRNHADPGSKFVSLMNAIPVLREVNEKHSKALMGMKQKSPENYKEQFPSIHREVFH